MQPAAHQLPIYLSVCLSVDDLVVAFHRAAMMMNVLLGHRRKAGDGAQDEAGSPRPVGAVERCVSAELSDKEKAEAEKARDDLANGRWRESSWAAERSDWEEVQAHRSWHLKRLSHTHIHIRVRRARWLSRRRRVPRRAVSVSGPHASCLSPSLEIVRLPVGVVVVRRASRRVHREKTKQVGHRNAKRNTTERRCSRVAFDRRDESCCT